MRLGLQNDKLTISVGEWRFELPVERPVKFPSIAQVIQDRQRSSNRVRLDPADRAAFEECLSQLPGREEEKQPVVIDLNGHVVIVGRSNTADQATVCLELDRSLHIGPERRVSIGRQDLARVVKLGVESFFFFGAGMPVLACGPQSQFVWMP